MASDWFPIRSDRGHAPNPTRIPWSVADKAYSVYSARYGREQSLERLAERGGFGAGEMDEFYPAWRDECSEITRLRAEVERLTRERDEAHARSRDFITDAVEKSKAIEQAEFLLSQQEKEIAIVRERLTSMMRLLVQAAERIDYWHRQSHPSTEMDEVSARVMRGIADEVASDDVFDVKEFEWLREWRSTLE